MIYGRYFRDVTRALQVNSGWIEQKRVYHGIACRGCSRETMSDLIPKLFDFRVGRKMLRKKGARKMRLFIPFDIICLHSFAANVCGAPLAPMDFPSVC